MDRETLQKRAVELLSQHHRLLCQWATGVGKSNIAIRFLQEHPGADCLILVPEQNNIQNWLTEFDKFGVSTQLVQIVCYASFHKFRNTAWDLVVYDEAPHIDTDKRREIAKDVRAKNILALGAVIDEEEEAALKSVYGEFVKFSVSLKNAIDWGILPPPKVNILHMKLDDKERLFKYRGRLLTALEMYKAIQSKVEKAVQTYNASSNAFNRQRMLRAGNERKRFLGMQKEAALSKICSALSSRGKRFLCFCPSIQMAERLGGDNAFTSKSPVSMKHLDKFNNHEIDSLYVVGKLIEGQNLVDIQCGVLGQLGGTTRITVQECGRIMRSPSPELYVPVIDGTKDDSFLYTLTSSISEEYIKHYNF